MGRGGQIDSVTLMISAAELLSCENSLMSSPRHASAVIPASSWGVGSFGRVTVAYHQMRPSSSGIWQKKPRLPRYMNSVPASLGAETPVAYPPVVHSLPYRKFMS